MNEWGFQIKPLLSTYMPNYGKPPEDAWLDEWDYTAVRTQDSKFEPCLFEAEHASSSFPQYWIWSGHFERGPGLLVTPHACHARASLICVVFRFHRNKMFLLRPLVKILHCGELLWPRGSVLRLSSLSSGGSAGLYVHKDSFILFILKPENRKRSASLETRRDRHWF